MRFDVDDGGGAGSLIYVCMITESWLQHTVVMVGGTVTHVMQKLCGRSDGDYYCRA